MEREKGTGHARQGSAESPQWTGGGVVFAPVELLFQDEQERKESSSEIRSYFQE